MTNTVRLRHVAQINPSTPAFERLSNDDVLTFIPMESVWPGERLDLSAQRTKASVATGYTRFQDGDVLVPKITPTFEAARSVLISGLLSGVGAGTTELHVVRPGSTIEARFLLYLMHTHSFLKLGKAEMYGVAGQQRVPDDFLRDLSVKLPPLEEQRHIANFLDAETARIDKLIQTRAKQFELMAERIDAARDRTFGSDVAGACDVPLMHLTDPYRPIVYGIVQAGPEVSNGVPYIKTGDINDLRPERLSRTSPEIHLRYRRAAVRPGDIVMAMRASIGAVTVVPEDLPEANLTQGTARIAAAKNVEPAWLFQALQSRRVREQCDVRAVGTTFRTLNIWDLRRLLVRAVDLIHQKAAVREFESVEANYIRYANAVERQRSTLSERRQALITAAVTGQFDVSAASGRGIEE